MLYTSMHLYALVAASVMLSGVHGLVWFYGI